MQTPPENKSGGVLYFGTRSTCCGQQPKQEVVAGFSFVTI